MSGPALYAVGVLLTWTGYVLGLRALFLAASRRGIPATAAAVGGGLALLAGTEISGGSFLRVPLVWIVMPFAAWAGAVCAATMLVRLFQALMALGRDEVLAKLGAAGLWALAAVTLVLWYRLDPTSRISVLRGSIPLSGGSTAALALLAGGAVAAMAACAQAAKARRLCKAVAVQVALIVGSIVFGVPFAWLVLTSFKEDADIASPSGIVWIPRVSETVAYLDPTAPLYRVVDRYPEVEGRLVSANLLEVSKPASMRGATIEIQQTELRPVPEQVPLVLVEMDGVPVDGMLIERLPDGRDRVQAISPPSLKGRQQVYAPDDVQAIHRPGLRFQNYADALDYLPPEAREGLVYLRNTLLVVVLSVVGTLLSSSIVAYAFARMRFPGKDALFAALLATMMLPGAVTKLPQFLIFKHLGWIDTLYPLWVPAFLGSAFAIFLLRQFLARIPRDLEDAARIDGAGYGRSFWSIMLPQIKPALAVVAVLTFVGSWNDFMNPLIYVGSPGHMTISYALQLFAAERLSQPGLVTAFTTLAILPVLVLFFLAQRYFTEDIRISGMGGR